MLSYDCANGYVDETLAAMGIAIRFEQLDVRRIDQTG
jgi:hypothetical protein